MAGRQVGGNALLDDLPANLVVSRGRARKRSGAGKDRPKRERLAHEISSNRTGAWYH
jgi:hypothetical protein